MVRPIPSRIFQRRGERESPLRGEQRQRLWRVREDVKPFSLENGFWRDAENGNRDGRALQQSSNHAVNSSWPDNFVLDCI